MAAWHGSGSGHTWGHSVQLWGGAGCSMGSCHSMGSATSCSHVVRAAAPGSMRVCGCMMGTWLWGMAQGVAMARGAPPSCVVWRAALGCDIGHVGGCDMELLCGGVMWP